MKKEIKEIVKKTNSNLDEINRLKDEVEKLWEPIITQFDSMSEEEVLEIYHKTMKFGGDINQKANAFWRKKFGN